MKTVLITGCSSGIGLQAARTLQQRGYKVFAGVRKLADRERLLEMGLDSLIIDVNDSASIHTAIQQIRNQTNNHLDALINNAGFGLMGAIEDLSRDSLRAQFETNVFGLQELTNLIIPMMRQQKYGRIINVSSILGLVTMEYRGAYAASKYAVEALSDALRLELRNTGIYVSLIEPGPITSEFRSTAKNVYEHTVDQQNSAHSKVYSKLLEDQQRQKENSRFTLGPEAVVEKIIHALESSHPRPRYCVTTPAHFLAILKRLLPSRWLDMLMAGR